MTLAHAQVRELLEAYALCALAHEDRAAVERHLVECTTCREQARELNYVVDAIPETLAGRAPGDALRERVLSAARADAGQARPRARVRLPMIRAALAVTAAFALVSAGSLAFALETRRQMDAMRAEQDELGKIVMSVSQGGRWWYMQGAEAFEGSGGTLIYPRREGQPFVIFHDLRPVPLNSQYAIWMIASDGKWVRAANFTASGRALQRVDLPVGVSEFVQCAVTVEVSESGPRAGPIAMQSRVFAP